MADSNQLALAIAIAVALSCGIGGCNSNTVKKTQELRQGMTTEQVTSLLGNPSSTEMTEGYLVWRYDLFKPFYGQIPYDLAFTGQPSSLVAWQANMREYYATQSLWLQSIPRQSNVNVNQSIQGQIRVVP